MTKLAAHAPVMLPEVLTALAPHEGGIYVDGTFGRGGYSCGILKTVRAHVIGIDRDPDAVSVGKILAKEFAPRFTMLQGPFGAMDVLLAGIQVARVDGVALDLGVSSPQLDEATRGFSFRADGPLDMRMSRSGPTAADLVNELPEDELADIIYHCGEERLARRVAKRIVEARAKERILRTSQLADIVRSAVPRSADGIDPATRTFQALRIHVNDELGELRRGLVAAERLLKPQGRLVVVSFHSLEDRVVKDFLRHRSGLSPSPSRHTPATNDNHARPSFCLVTRKPQVPSDDESRRNPRARAASPDSQATKARAMAICRVAPSACSARSRIMPARGQSRSCATLENHPSHSPCWRGSAARATGKDSSNPCASPEAQRSEASTRCPSSQPGFSASAASSTPRAAATSPCEASASARLRRASRLSGHARTASANSAAAGCPSS